MDLFQIVVITIVAVASVAVIAGFLVMVVGSERRATGRAKTRIAPGWYPDAHDESLLRYFDGRVPTQKTAKREVI
ncbi:DUF2510 domain-containing protein [Rhodococcus sp. BP-252]|uniref:DUF2510 domain-containing protein n=1 Tax=Rhodococcoides kyotonense TaxID=398843 RepID=A0A177YDL5_9NOCA|nr:MULTISPECIES: DUF2510 domain-containing protein [Rhodococcus]MBY6414061.1 DUF2510 domain-containing protein [Rhodococcus sp. BP-320]MBY6418832.1 DUF2510 domain-containing protein [Rhodococcus sp. BP-321]MBY6423423.1 DUF2510 domain-containing protein [Rhodococcus sp. BP-324]MBY6428877.1 DUF2510 domain-containing protein [Rhodococcus sp. BP-323]MBY6433883.1 DUF2510 domain-containing protein [Rhodococcus sp. BP-322]